MPDSLERASQELVRKLHPARFTAMSPRMASIVGCVLHKRFADPELIGLTVTADGFVLGMPAGAYGFDEFLGASSDLYRNWEDLLRVAGLTTGEREEADQLFSLMLRNGRAL